ncbi:hypothetical protein GALMADRAFT_452002 [Galerina marginata CBS 339.88]|uniref:Ubiquitin-like domain-containing protein n=1 Tax=Galerina marginata (strain CBS 339.88) TaxID=685588 RepID=A0A067T085_GALM3|nr:hypothetical protein GALMADRAFT_452002 [Galerina marginata CBS 339.88]
MPVFAFTAGSLGDILATAGLIAPIIQVLYDNRNVSKECDTLATELRSLQQVLILTQFALQHYESTPLGEPLARFVCPEVVQCHMALVEFSDKIASFRESLASTSISNLWRRVVWAAFGETESLTAKLSGHRLKLALLLASMNSLEFLHQGPSASHGTSVVNETSYSSQARIRDKMICVVDPLGDTIPIPILFCSSWENFHYVLNGYSQNRVSQAYVERGDYKIILPDGRLLPRSYFAKAVKEGVVLEISIVVKFQMTNAIGTEAKIQCPRCSFINAEARSWRQKRCSRCSCHFNIDFLSEYVSSAEISNQAQDVVLHNGGDVIASTELNQAKRGNVFSSYNPSNPSGRP